MLTNVGKHQVPLVLGFCVVLAVAPGLPWYISLDVAGSALQPARLAVATRARHLSSGRQVVRNYLISDHEVCVSAHRFLHVLPRSSLESFAECDQSVANLKGTV